MWADTQSGHIFGPLCKCVCVQFIYSVFTVSDGHQDGRPAL